MQKQKSKPTLVAVFAHPDDEAFGPAGTIAKFSKTHDVYILCATKGEVGESSIYTKSLYTIREEELKRSAKILGAKKVFFLGFRDGTLSNNLYHKLAGKIQEKLIKFQPETIITYEPLGVSGHIDHITVSLVTTYVARNLKVTDKLLYYCIAKREREYLENYFIYFPQGYKREGVDFVVDVSTFWDKKLDAIHTHKSQSKDAQSILKVIKKLPKEEYFLKYKG